MRASIQACISLLAFAGLSYQAAAWAASTSVSKLPIKATIFAKPNVIMGVDDSGSMDFEIMLSTNDGAMWWNTTAGATLRSGWTNGSPNFNDDGVSDQTWRKYAYLFPNGMGSRLRILNDANYGHFAVMPTAQFAWLRSSRFNPIYYNPATTYYPWSPLAQAGYNFANATPGSARPHPLLTTAGTAWDLTSARALTTTADNVFTALGGMLVPKGARIRDCDFNNANCGAWAAAILAADTPVPGNRVYRVAMAYRAATYWKEDTTCVLPPTTTSVADIDCVMAPDGATRLKRVQINAGDAEMQNFANWFQYHRKRVLMLNAAMGEVLESLTGINGGYVAFNNRPSTATRVGMNDLDSTDNLVNGQALAKIFYDVAPNGGTPTRETLLRVSQEFVDIAGPIRYACQRNAALIVTDGFANNTAVTPPNYTPLAGVDDVAPYATTHPDTLADIALSYYRNRLRTDFAAGKVAKVTGRDDNPDLHVNTYGMTLGARGQLFSSAASLRPTTAGSWISPPANRHPASIDDLWHATINGRGQMYTANNTADTVTGMLAAFDDIKDDLGSQGSAAVSSVNLGRGNGDVYLTSYNPKGWVGDVAAYPIDPNTAQISYSDASRMWSASALLLARTSARQVFTQHNGAVAVFSDTAASGGVVGAVNPGLVYGANDAVMNYLRGQRSGEVSQPGGTFRNRTSLMGPVVNSEPVVSRDDDVLFVQSGEGMLHAFSVANANAGQELWAFVPRAVLSTIGATTRPGYIYATKLDGQMSLRRIDTATNLLVAGMGAAGKSYHAVNVHAPTAITESNLPSVWEFPTASDTVTQGKMGLAVGKPRIVKTSAASSSGLRVLVTSGYETPDGLGRLWMLNPDGTVVREFLTPSGGTTSAPAELAHVTGYLEDTGTVRYVYAGDLQGHLWRFDLDNTGTGSAGVTKLASLRDASGNAQPMTAAPEVTYIDGKRVVIVGTGRLLSESDLGGSATQSVYAIADGSDIGNARAATGINGLVQQTYTSAPAAITDLTVNWSTKRGWFVDLPAGEKVTATPQLARGSLLFASNLTDTNCGASSKLYALDVTNGGIVDDAPNLSPSTVISSQSNVTALSILQSRDGRLFVGGRLTGTGDLFGQVSSSPAQTFTRRVPGDTTIAPKINAWRESRSR